MLSLLVHARVSYTTILESFLTSLLPKTRTKVSQTAHRLLSGSLNRPLRTLSCFASRFFCIVALQLISPSVRCPYANALSLIHPAFQVPYGGEPAVLCQPVGHPGSAAGGAISAGQGFFRVCRGREEREKEAQDKGRKDTEGRAPQISS